MISTCNPLASNDTHHYAPPATSGASALLRLVVAALSAALRTPLSHVGGGQRLRAVRGADTVAASVDLVLHPGIDPRGQRVQRVREERIKSSRSWPHESQLVARPAQ